MKKIKCNRFILTLCITLPLLAGATQCSSRSSADAELNKRKNIEFLTENGNRPEVHTTASHLQYQVLAEGAGNTPTATDFVTVNYTGSLISGQVFDRGEAIGFPLNGVIPGWTEGLQLMKEGGKSRFFIPSDLAYGEKGIGPIPPDSALIFDIELLKIGR